MKKSTLFSLLVLFVLMVYSSVFCAKRTAK